MSTHRQCGDDRWNSAVGRAKGTKEESRALNAYLDLLQAKVFEAEHEMTQAGELITSDALRNKLLGKGEQPYLLTDIIIEHNDRVRQLIGKGFAKATWTKYETTLKHIGNFLQWKYSKKDVAIRDLQLHFITDFEFYLRKSEIFDTNTNGKYIKNLKKIVHECVIKAWLDKDPFIGFKVKHRQVDKAFLSEHELQLLMKHTFPIERTELVKDLFLLVALPDLPISI